VLVPGRVAAGRGVRVDEEFAAFVRAVLPELLRFGVAVAGSRTDAEDLVQGALESTGRRWRHVRGQGDATGYVKRAMVNAHISRWRRLRRERLTHTAPALATVIGDLPFEGPMWAALAGLPPRQRAVLVLRYYEDLTEVEIAAVLGCAPGTVKSQASKALAHLRRTLADQRGGDAPGGGSSGSATGREEAARGRA
jgi:RNA polymerase sigma-70 factor (sigma-E family)